MNGPFATFVPADPVDAARLARLRRLAWLIDAKFRLPGTQFRFGINSVICIVPVAGDAVLGFIAVYIVWEGSELGLPRWRVWQMLGNCAVQAVIGAVPILGTFVDMGMKMNLRNLAIIEKCLAQGTRR
jgi:hypothetical protein